MPAVTSAALGIAGTAGKFGAIASGLGDLASVAAPFLPTGGDNSDYAKHRILKTVNDARSAGIHPLYALGAGGGVTPGFEVTTGSAVGDSLQRLGNVAQRRTAENEAKAASGILSPVEQAQMLALHASAKRDLESAALSASETALNTQKLNTMGRDRIGPMLDEAIKYNDIFGGTPIPRAMREVRLPDGSTMLVPNTDVLESGEAIGNVLTATELAKRGTKRAARALGPRQPRNSSATKAEAAIQRALSTLKKYGKMWLKGPFYTK